MHQISVNIPETWIVIGYYSLKKKSQKAKCFAENVISGYSNYSNFLHDVILNNSHFKRHY